MSLVDVLSLAANHEPGLADFGLLLRNSTRVFELRVFEFLLKYCSQNGIVGICWNMSKNIQNGSLKKAKLSKIPLWGRSGPHWGALDSFGFFEAAFLCIFLDIFQQMPMPFWLQ